ncbi:MAG: TRAP transporter large permease subunit [Pseudomonadota bacterium]
MALALFVCVVIVLMAGFPVALTLAGTSLVFAAIGLITGQFDAAFLGSIPNRLYGIMTNDTLVAVPLFIFMGITLERAKIAEALLDALSRAFSRGSGGLGIAVVLVGMLLAASTGIVGATVVTMGLLSLPTMLKRGYAPSVATGTICAAGTLGQIIPPSIVLVLLGDVLSAANQQAQIASGNYSGKTISVGDLFAGALLPGLMLVGLYLAWLIWLAWRQPTLMPAPTEAQRAPLGAGQFIRALLAPLVLIIMVLGSILTGKATPTEAAGVGAAGALGLAALRGSLNIAALEDIMQRTVRVTSMVFLILIGASIFALVFRGYDGDVAVHALLADLPGGMWSAFVVVMLVMFLLGFVLDFIEITFVVVPIVGPVLLGLGIDPIWLGVMIAINLQTSFLTPPFGFALFYLRGVAPASVTTGDLYRGVIPFIIIQLLAMLVLALVPQIATWLPSVIYG